MHWDHEPESCATAPWSAVKSEAIHRFGFGISERSGSPGPHWLPIQSGDFEDFVAAVQTWRRFQRFAESFLMGHGSWKADEGRGA